MQSTNQSYYDPHENRGKREPWYLSANPTRPINQQNTHANLPFLPFLPFLISPTFSYTFPSLPHPYCLTPSALLNVHYRHSNYNSCPQHEPSNFQQTDTIRHKKRSLAIRYLVYQDKEKKSPSPLVCIAQINILKKRETLNVFASCRNHEQEKK
jgi:hypothetical protein